MNKAEYKGEQYNIETIYIYDEYISLYKGVLLNSNTIKVPLEECIILSMNKELLLRIVDSCFHEFASNYRSEAKEKSSLLYDEFINPKKPNGKDCLECGSKNTITIPSKIVFCYDCNTLNK